MKIFDLVPRVAIVFVRAMDRASLRPESSIRRHSAGSNRKTRCDFARSSMRQVAPKFSGRLSHHFLEHAVEMRQRLETDFVGNLADAQVRIQQEVAGVFDPYSRKVFGEIDSRELLE